MKYCVGFQLYENGEELFSQIVATYRDYISEVFFAWQDIATGRSAIAPYIISNLNFPEKWFTKTSSCDKICHRCGYCKAVLEQVLINTEENV